MHVCPSSGVLRHGSEISNGWIWGGEEEKKEGGFDREESGEAGKKTVYSKVSVGMHMCERQ